MLRRGDPVWLPESGMLASVTNAGTCGRPHRAAPTVLTQKVKQTGRSQPQAEAGTPDLHELLPDTCYFVNASSSSIISPNCSSAALTGSAVVMSAPAIFSSSMGGMELPEDRKRL